MNNRLSDRLTKLESLTVKRSPDEPTTYKVFLFWCELFTGGPFGGHDHNGFGITCEQFEAMEFDSMTHAYQWTESLCKSHRDSWTKRPRPATTSNITLDEATNIYTDNLKAMRHGGRLVAIC